MEARYRDYHRRTVHDLRPWNNAGGHYDAEAAAAAARSHAGAFVDRVVERAGDGGLVCCALDTELLGHWWYEGPTWLAEVLKQAPRAGLDLVTVSEGVDRVPAVERELVASTWGAGKNLSTWEAPGVSDLAFAARAAELRTVSAASTGRGSRDALARAARELLALQSSDWAFMVTRALASDYPQRRVEAHQADHDAAMAALTDSAAVPAPALRHLAPDLDLASLTTP